MFYLFSFVKDDPRVEVECPACGTVHVLESQKWLDKKWVLTCRACAGTFGVGSPAVFSMYVGKSWSKKKKPDLEYVDFIIVDFQTGPGFGVNRWHGWVDSTTREVVQVG